MDMNRTRVVMTWRQSWLIGPVAMLWSLVLSGCAAVSNPVADAIPVNRLPPDVLGRPRAEEKTIPLVMLRQKPVEVYKLAPGDTLGIYIENALGEKDKPPPVHFPGENGQTSGLPPSLGFPIPVRDDGTIQLPLIDPVNVDGLSLIEAENKIVEAYTVKKQILKRDSLHPIVTLLRPRQSHILVVRQDSGGLGTVGLSGVPGGAGAVGATKRGTGQVIDLPAYENDLLNALARTGGLPGLDAVNEVVIQRGVFKAGMEKSDVQTLMGSFMLQYPGIQNIRIPLRLRPGDPVPFRPEDVILNTGDIVFIEARDTEVYYVGGLMAPRQFTLPRDYDLDVVNAVALGGGPLLNTLTTNSLSGNITTPGIGFPSPSLVVILRKTPDGGQIPIRVSLNKAMRDPRERVLIQAGDIIILQQTPAEALAQYITSVLHFNFLGTIINQEDLLGTGNLTLP